MESTTKIRTTSKIKKNPKTTTPKMKMTSKVKATSKVKTTSKMRNEEDFKTEEWSYLKNHTSYTISTKTSSIISHIILCHESFIIWYIISYHISRLYDTLHQLFMINQWLLNIATLGLHLGFSAKLKIWQVSACKMEPRSGTIITDWASQPASQPTSQPSTYLVFKCCAVSPPQLCAVSPP